MTASVSVESVDVRGLSVLEARTWRDDLLRRHRTGERVVSVFGRALQGDAVITAVFARGAALAVTRARVGLQEGVHELTSELPMMHAFERELHEQTGLRVAAHPWLKPIRAERGPDAMRAYVYHRVEGKEVHEVAVGPVHAGVIEPGSFRFSCLGERVLHLEIQLGYQHRGVEARLLRGDPRRQGALVESIVGDSGVAHAWAWAAALEGLIQHDSAAETERTRAVALELERAAMHLAGLSGMSADLGFLQGATTYGRLRTIAINTSMTLFGSRFGKGAVRPGAGATLTADSAKAARGSVAQLRAQLPIIHERFVESISVQHRLKGTGELSRERALSLGVVGMAARASGVSMDARHDARLGVYEAHPIEPQQMAEGDCWARARLRIAELDVSLAWLERVLAVDPAPTPVAPSSASLPAARLSVARVEGWRGEVVHAIETGEDGTVAHYKVQDPSLRNWMGLALAVRDDAISDFPICNKSFDLSYCGNDL